MKTASRCRGVTLFVVWVGIFPAFSLTGPRTCFAGDRPLPRQNPVKLDPNLSAIGPEDGTRWYSVLDLGLQGQGWKETEHPFDRLPAKAKSVVRDRVWSLSHHSAGMCARFVTDATSISARWTLRYSNKALNHMPATGVSGLDLYVRENGSWFWCGVGIPAETPDNQVTLLRGIPATRREFLLYLPLYNGVESIEIGLPPGAVLEKAPPYPPEKQRPIVFYGTSITQGGCASRPGMAYPAILGRRLGYPVINLGFSGNGKMDAELGDLLGELEASLYVIDCLPNMTPEMVTERAPVLVRKIREAHPDTPILLVENIRYQRSWLVQGARRNYESKNTALREVYENLEKEGVTGLYYKSCEDLLGDDWEATVDGTHPTDLGFVRMADALEPVLRRILEE